MEFITNKSEFPFKARVEHGGISGLRNVEVEVVGYSGDTFIVAMPSGEGWSSIQSEDIIFKSSTAYLYEAAEYLTPVPSKKWKNVTKDGSKITRRIEDEDGESVGFVQRGTKSMPCRWGSDGVVWDDYSSDYNLVPAEPEVEYFYGSTDQGKGYPELCRELSKEKEEGDDLKLGFFNGKLVSAEVLK